MLKVLRKLTPVERHRLLSAAVESLVPHPVIEGELVKAQPSPDLVARLIAEAREELRLPENDTSPNSQRLILDLLTRSMANAFSNPQEAQERLGSRGALEPGAYDVHFGDNFEDLISKRGITRDQIQSALSSPDAVEHLPPMHDDATDRFSLFTKRDPGPSTLLVEATREKARLHVSVAWRIFHRDIRWDGVRGPLDLLRSFIEAFGKDFLLGNRPPQKLVEYDALSIAALGWSQADVEQLLHGNMKLLFRPIEWQPREEIYIPFRMRVSTLDVIEIQMMYMINLTKYYASLRAHGVERVG
jgi:hypothetical protein